MVTIRLMRFGKKGRPLYRIVVQESSRSAAAGFYLESLGHYDPLEKGAGLAVNLERVKTWQARGATTSPSVKTLLKKAKVAAAAA
jgi:small subunit ribosomal protein S16